MSRGGDFTGNLIRRVKKMIPLLVPLMLSAFRRAEELAVAMESRCYQGGTGRTQYRIMKLNRNDYIAIVVVALLILCVAAVSILNGF